MSNTKLNIAEITTNARSLGPGKRFALWVQGCPFNCKGCISQDWIPMKVASMIDIQQVARWIIESPGIEGISLSGGEPFLQGSALAELLEIVRSERPELNVIVFTGFKMEQLIWPEAEAFLKYIDVLIAGVYIEKLNDNKGLRGSSNQQIIHLSNRLLHQKDHFENGPRALEFQVDDSGVLMVGIPEKEFSW